METEGMTLEQKREFYIKRRIHDRLVRRVSCDISLEGFSKSLTPEEYRELTFFDRTVGEFYDKHHGEWKQGERNAMEGCIDIKDLKKGTVYRIASRNLIVGVWDGEEGFVGIRHKFGNKFLDTEYEWTTDRHHGTARAKAVLGVVPESMPLRATLPGSWCGKCGKPVNFDMSRPEDGRWQHDDGSVMCPKVFAQARNNDQLYAELEKFEAALEAATPKGGPVS